MSTHSELLYEFNEAYTELETMVHKTVAHRRKFLYACNQIQHFCESFSKINANEIVTINQLESFKLILKLFKKIRNLFYQNSLQNWGTFNLENSASTVIVQLCNISEQLNQASHVLYKDGSNAFDFSSHKWLQCHIMDLKAISKSFMQFKDTSDDSRMLEIVNKRLTSIEDFLKKYQKENIDQPISNGESSFPEEFKAWKVNLSDFDVIRKAGSGISSDVYQGLDKRTGKLVAIKKLNYEKLDDNKLQYFQRELTTSIIANHPTVLKFIGATDIVPFCFITEWMPNKTLYHDLHQNHMLDATMKTIAMYDIARGMNFLHLNQIIHRDLKSLNILLDEHGFIKISDFGLSRHFNGNDILTKNIGTPHWMAPELLNVKNNYDEKVDVYAYAIVCWECATGEIPYQDLEPAEIISKVLTRNYRPKFTSNVSAPLRTLIVDCWDSDPKMRPSFQQILRRFQNCDIFIEGADREKVMEHINSVKETNTPTFENTDINENIFENAPIENIVEMVEKRHLPKDFLEKAFDLICSIDLETQSNLFIKGLLAFLSTDLSLKSARKLRELPYNSLPGKIVMSMIAAIPTGRNDATDFELIIAACKNRHSAEAALHSMNTESLKLCLEVSAQTKVPPDLIEQLSELCIQSLNKEDIMLKVAALRCLITIGQTTKIDVNMFKTFFNSDNKTLLLVSYIAANQIVSKGIFLPIELIDILVPRWSNQQAAALLLASCKDLETSRYLIEKLLYDEIPSFDLTLKILKEASRHTVLHENIRTILDEIMNLFPAVSTTFVKTIQSIKFELLQNECE